MASNIFKIAPIFKRSSTKWIFSQNSRHPNLIRNLRTEANILSSVEKIPSVDGVTYPELLWSNLHKWENDKAFDCAITGRTYTHGEIFKKSRSFATALKQSGLKRNDIVGSFLPNIPETAIVFVGIWDAGLIVSPINPNYVAGEVSKQMSSSEAKTIVTIPELLPVVREAQKSCSNLKSVIVIGEAHQDCHSFFEMVKVDSTGKEFLKGSQITDDDIALLPYSSGTTGPPKGVMLTHKNMAVNLLQITLPDFHCVDFNQGGGKQDRLLAILPFFHIFGLNVVLAPTLYQGAFTTCLPKFEPNSFVAAVRKHKPTTMHLVTPIVNFMVQSPEFGQKEAEHLRSIVAGAAPLGKTIIHKFLDKLGGHVFFQEGFGMTELSPVSHLLRKSTQNKKMSSCGSILPASYCKVVDLDSGKALGPDEKGEICVKGPQVMKGYLKNEKATNETIDSEDWLHTGDIGYYDKDECFYIVDRLKELIKVKGLQVAPAELEDILRKHPLVADVAVIGVPCERSGEAPRAYVVTKENKSASEEEIANYVNKQVAEHKHLKGGVEFIKIIPKAASGKLLRRELKADYMKKHS